MQPWIEAAMHFSLCLVAGALAALAPLAANIHATFHDPFNNAHRAVAAPAPPPVPDLGLLLMVTATWPDGGMAQGTRRWRSSHTRCGTSRRRCSGSWWEPRIGWRRRGRFGCFVARVFRHLTYDARNFTNTNAADEVEQQRNVALSRIERHRLNGVVHFAGASTTYDLRFFQQLRHSGLVVEGESGGAVFGRRLDMGVGGRGEMGRRRLDLGRRRPLSGQQQHGEEPPLRSWGYGDR